MMLKPLNHRVLVEDPQLLERKVGSIIIPEGACEDAVDGHWVKCFAVGPKVRDIKVGDTIFLTRYSGHRVVVDGKPCVLTVEDDINSIQEDE